MKRAAGLLLVAVVLALVAGALASLALFALAVGLLLATLAAGVSVAATARRLVVTRSVLQREVGEDQPISVRLQVRGLGRLPLPVHLEAQADVNSWVPLGEGGGLVQLLVGRRGAWRLEPSRLRLRDSFGIQAWPLLACQLEPLLILPTPDRRVPIPPQPDARVGDPDLDLDGLEPYVPGTPISRVHWPALARGAGLQQRRLAAPPGGLPLVVVDTANTGDPRAVDWAARTAAGAILRLVGTGGCRVQLPGDQAATTVTDLTAAWRGVHRRLALLQPGCPATGQGPLEAGEVLHVRAADAPAEALGTPPPPLPPGVVAAATEQRAGP